MSMTIYFKNGETLHIPGREGQAMKEKIGAAIITGMGGLIVLEDEDGGLQAVLNLDEVAAIR